MCYDDHSKIKICLFKKFPNSEKSTSITIVIFDKRIHILYRLSLHGLIFKYNKVLKYLYGRGKVFVTVDEIVIDANMEPTTGN